MSAYLCTWERPDNPTRHMSESEMRQYYKDHAVEGDMAFLLEAVTLPADIRQAAENLLALVRSRKQRPADRYLVDQLRECCRAVFTGQPYQVPAVPAVAPAAGKARRVAAVRPCCPACGYSEAA